jgi:2-polyprenyl-3-methyl-5-hydroxy-6-metoxy-1,4-benzoquinol methylase/GNAT superfamily N-acetyltransferase
MKMPNMITYLSKPTEKLTEDELKQCSELFSNHYGTYAAEDPRGRSGRHIKLQSSYYKQRYVRGNYHVALAFDSDIIVGQAFYIREKLDEGIYTWVLQLVVHKDYRRQGIAGRLLHSIWGFSNDCAWGLATTNPFTIKTLESSTLRHADPKQIKRHEKLVRKICDRIPYIQELTINDTNSKAFTDFYVQTDEVKIDRIPGIGVNWLLGEIKPGEEWTAFTFRDQEYDDDFIDELKRIITYSEDVLKEAYGRMDMESHSWAMHAAEEIDSIESIVGSLCSQTVLDAGCGYGRHSLEIAKRCPTSHVVGIDFSESNIDKAIKAKGDIDNLEYYAQDLKKGVEGQYDLVLCLYDVVGSFPEIEDNVIILKRLYDACKKGGHLVLSVMNMESTLANAKKENIVDIEKHPEVLFRLPASDTMQNTGDIFDPEYYIVDNIHRIVYRKEQFSEADSLPSEYVIRDRRYTMDEIKSAVKSAGFKIGVTRYVQAGKWDIPLGPLDKRAKEILLVAEK